MEVRIEPMHRQALHMQLSPRCGARMRQGSPCQSPAVKGRKRCRMHDGGAAAEPRPATRNALKPGRYTRELLRESAEKLKLIQVGRGPPEGL
jgi:hypothetical protein